MSDDELRELTFKSALDSMLKMNLAERGHLAKLLSRMLQSTSKAKAKRLQETIIVLYGRPAGFSRKLRRIMYDRGISPAQLAHELELSTQRISALMSGKGRPREKTISSIAWVLKVNEDQLRPDD